MYIKKDSEKFEFDDKFRETYNFTEDITTSSQTNLDSQQNQKMIFDEINNVFFTCLENQFILFNLQYLKEFALILEQNQDKNLENNPNIIQFNLPFYADRLFFNNEQKEKIIISSVPSKLNGFHQELYLIDKNQILQGNLLLKKLLKYDIEENLRFLQVNFVNENKIYVNTKEKILQFNGDKIEQEIKIQGPIFRNKEKQEIYYFNEKKLYLLQENINKQEMIQQFEIDYDQIIHIRKLEKFILIIYHKEFKFNIVIYNEENKQYEIIEDFIDLTDFYEIENYEQIYIETYEVFLKQQNLLILTTNIFNSFYIIGLENGQIIIYQIEEDKLPHLALKDGEGTQIRGFLSVICDLRQNKEEKRISKNFKNDDGIPLEIENFQNLLMIDNFMRIRIREFQDYRDINLRIKSIKNNKIQNLIQIKEDFQIEQKNDQKLEQDNNMTEVNNPFTNENKQDDVNKKQSLFGNEKKDIKGLNMFANNNSNTLFNNKTDGNKDNFLGNTNINTGSFPNKIEGNLIKGFGLTNDSTNNLFTKKIEDKQNDTQKPIVNNDINTNKNMFQNQQEKKNQSDTTKGILNTKTNPSTFDIINKNEEKIKNNEINLNQTIDSIEPKEVEMKFDLKNLNLTNDNKKQDDNLNKLNNIIPKLSDLDIKPLDEQKKQQNQQIKEQDIEKNNIQQSPKENKQSLEQLNKEQKLLDEFKKFQDKTKNDKHIFELSNRLKEKLLQELEEIDMNLESKYSDDIWQKELNDLSELQQNFEKQTINFTEENEQVLQKEIELIKDLIQNKKFENEFSTKLKDIKKQQKELQMILKYQNQRLQLLETELKNSNLIKKPIQNEAEKAITLYNNIIQKQNLLRKNINCSYKLSKQLLSIEQTQNLMQNKKTIPKTNKKVQNNLSKNIYIQPLINKQASYVHKVNRRKKPKFIMGELSFPVKEINPLEKKKQQYEDIIYYQIENIEKQVKKLKDELEIKNIEQNSQSTNGDFVLDLTKISQDNIFDFEQVDRILPRDQFFESKFDKQKRLMDKLQQNLKQKVFFNSKTSKKKFICYNLIDEKNLQQKNEMVKNLTFGSEEIQPKLSSFEPKNPQRLSMTTDKQKNFLQNELGKEKNQDKSEKELDYLFKNDRKESQLTSSFQNKKIQFGQEQKQEQTNSNIQTSKNQFQSMFTQPQQKQQEQNSQINNDQNVEQKSQANKGFFFDNKKQEKLDFKFEQPKDQLQKQNTLFGQPQNQQQKNGLLFGQPKDLQQQEKTNTIKQENTEKDIFKDQKPFFQKPEQQPQEKQDQEKTEQLPVQENKLLNQDNEKKDDIKPKLTHQITFEKSNQNITSQINIDQKQEQKSDQNIQQEQSSYSQIVQQNKDNQFSKKNLNSLLSVDQTQKNEKTPIKPESSDLFTSNIQPKQINTQLTKFQDSEKQQIPNNQQIEKSEVQPSTFFKNNNNNQQKPFFENKVPSTLFPTNNQQKTSFQNTGQNQISNFQINDNQKNIQQIPVNTNQNNIYQNNNNSNQNNSIWNNLKNNLKIQNTQQNTQILQTPQNQQHQFGQSSFQQNAHQNQSKQIQNFGGFQSQQQSWLQQNQQNQQNKGFLQSSFGTGNQQINSFQQGQTQNQFNNNTQSFGMDPTKFMKPQQNNQQQQNQQMFTGGKMNFNSLKQFTYNIYKNINNKINLSICIKK